MDSQLTEELKRRLEEAKVKERELWKLQQETEAWAKPVIKRFEEARSQWCEQVKKCQIISAFLDDDSLFK